jgi:hypothetical protein
MQLQELVSKTTDRRKELKMSVNEASEDFSRWTLYRFEKGEDISLSKFLLLLDKLKLEIRFIKR